MNANHYHNVVVFKFLLQNLYEKCCEVFVGNEVEDVVLFKYVHLPSYHINHLDH